MSKYELLPTDTLAAAEASWERPQKSIRNLGSTSVSASIIGALDAAVGKYRKRKEKLGFGALDQIDNPEIRELFKREFEDYGEIFAGAGIKVPTPDYIASRGINFKRLAEMKEDLPDYDLVVAPLTMSLDLVYELVNAVANDTTIRNNPLGMANKRATRKTNGLYVGLSADDWHFGMMEASLRWRMSSTSDCSFSDDLGSWTVFLMPNGDKLDDLPDYDLQILQSVHVIGYITYQLHRIRQGVGLLDTDRSSVVSDILEGKLLTARYSKDKRRIEISPDGLSRMDSVLGSYPVVGIYRPPSIM